MRKTLPEAADWSEAKEKGHVEKNDMLQVLFGGERKILNYVVVAIAFVALLLIFTQQVGGVVAVSVLGACARLSSSTSSSSSTPNAGSSASRSC